MLLGRTCGPRLLTTVCRAELRTPGRLGSNLWGGAQRGFRTSGRHGVVPGRPPSRVRCVQSQSVLGWLLPLARFGPARASLPGEP